MFAPVGLLAIDAFHIEEKETVTLRRRSPSCHVSSSAMMATASLAPHRIEPRCRPESTPMMMYQPTNIVRQKHFRQQVALSGISCHDKSLPLADQVHAIFATIQGMSS
jgi:hypothetical protein